MVRVRDGVPIRACLIGGTRLSYAGISLEAPAPVLNAEIAAVERDEAADEHAFIIDGELAATDSLAGTWAIVTHGDGTTNGYEIAGAERDGDSTRLLLAGDPGFELDGDSNTRWIYYPGTTIQGRPRVGIETVAYVEAVR
jgi:hypothetical protein